MTNRERGNKCCKPFIKHITTVDLNNEGGSDKSKNSRKSQRVHFNCAQSKVLTNRIKTNQKMSDNFASRGSIC